MMFWIRKDWLGGETVVENEEGKFKKEPGKEVLGPEADDNEDTYEEQRDMGGREKSGGSGGSGGSVR